MIDLLVRDGWKARQYIRQVVLRFDSTTAAADEYRVNQRTTPRGVRMPDEQPAAAADSRGLPALSLDPIQQTNLADEPDRLGAVFAQDGVEMPAAMSQAPEPLQPSLRRRRAL
jgi:hypothetical protein